jgi:hypothetical protein
MADQHYRSTVDVDSNPAFASQPPALAEGTMIGSNFNDKPASLS